MTREVRRLIFVFFLLIFIIAVPMIILYALGYNFDSDKKILISTGGLYLKSIPPKAEIYINDKLQGKTNGFVRHLSPQIYNVKIIKEGYHSWEKNLNVKPGLVELADNILLLPLNPKISLTNQTTIQSFSLLPNQRELLYFASNSFHLLDLTRGTERAPIISLPRTFSPDNFIWSNDNENFIVYSGNQYYLANINNPDIFTDINALIKKLSKYTISKIENLNFDITGNKIYFASNNNLYTLTLDKQKPANSSLSSILISNIINYVPLGDKIIYLDYFTGKINRFDPVTLQTEVLIETIIPSFNQGKWIVSNDYKKLLCQKDSSVEILWLEDGNGQITRHKEELEKIDFGEKINNIIWYSQTNEHLIISTDEAILVAELDNREPQNIIKLITTEKPQITYNPYNQLLYFLSQNRLYQTEI